jgi:predicted ATPase
MVDFGQITVKGYRRLYNVPLEMRPLTVMIGANGVGKTSFLDVLSLLADSAKGQLLERIGGSLEAMLTRDKADHLAISLEMAVPAYEPLKYYLRLVPARGSSYEIGLETLTHHTDLQKPQPLKYIESRSVNVRYFNQNTGHLEPPSWEHNPFETSLSQVPKMYQQPESLRNRLASLTSYGALDVSDRSPVRLPQEMRPAKLPGKNGGELVSCLYDLRETSPDRFEVVEDTLAAAFPDFEKLSFPPVAAGKLSMTWKDKNFSRPIYVHELSEGTLRFLWLVTLLQSRELGAITLIDEPEVSLHPELLRLLADLMREASKRTQLIVATHSDRLIRFLKPEEVLVCDAEDGLMTATWANTLDLEKWLSEYGLDEVWSMNVMGGRP